ncbi:hypothetical protein T07_957 [Trichinella nelsoni]|uniref:Uncharacterized protein n=1 Tax=Trichinella nelsoni TaxID=6336 RepID=A0A0V0RV50_9BILA|nr:hypothetical protein T07_957 [Trichinella nelsoni]
MYFKKCKANNLQMTECQHKQQWSDFHKQAPLLLLFPFASQCCWKGRKVFYMFEEQADWFVSESFPLWLYRPVESTDAHVLLVGHFNGHAGSQAGYHARIAGLSASIGTRHPCRASFVPVKGKVRVQLCYFCSLSSFASQ